MLDAPVSGGTTGAEAATIAIMVGGDKKVFDDALPVLQSFSANVIHMGGLGTGTVAKLVNNMLSFCNMAALCEGMMLGTGYGLEPEKLLQVISSSSGNSNAIKNFTLRALPGHYSPPSFALDLAYKDLHLASSSATSSACRCSRAPRPTTCSASPRAWAGARRTARRSCASTRRCCAARSSRRRS